MKARNEAGRIAETMPNSYHPREVSDLPPSIERAIERRTRTLSAGYRLFYSEPLNLVRGQGAYVYDRNGDEYLDAYNNVPCIGHSHPLVAEAVASQLARLNIGNRYLQDEIVAYSERLLETTSLGDPRIMYTCSGSEANDLAYRVAVQATGGRGVVVTSNAYHGVTDAVARFSPSLGRAVPLSPYVRTIDPPRPQPGETQDEVPQRMLSQVVTAVDDLARHGVGLAALVCDTVFSSDGIYFDPPGALAPAIEFVQDRGGLFVADEVQAGFHRTGQHWWGFQRHALTPDIVTTGKAMANGMPLAAVIMRADLDEDFGQRARYVSTFGGVSASIAAAAVVLRVLEEEELGLRAAEVGEQMAEGTREAFRHVDVGADVRQEGLFIAIEPHDETSPVAEGPAMGKLLVEGLRRRRVLASTTGASGQVLKVRPPMIFGRREVERFVTSLEESLAELMSGSLQGSHR